MESSGGNTNVTAVTSRARWLSWGTNRDGPPSARAGDWKSRRRVLVLAGALTVLILLGLVVAFVVGLALSGRDVSRTLRMPRWAESHLQRDEIAYPSHVALARSFSLLRFSPVAEGLQWLKAAAHATSDDQIRTIGDGLRSALARAAPTQTTQVSAQLCQAAISGSQPGHAMVVALAGLDCQFELRVLGHVPEGQPIYYQNNPPTGGPHYDGRFPSYGVVTDAVLPGYWVHNLEHGAVVVLYRCDDSCPGLVDTLRDFYGTLPTNRNSPSGAPRLLALSYADLPAPLALVSWGQSILLDRFDPEIVRDFYAQHVDRGPECRGLRCPE